MTLFIPYDGAPAVVKTAWRFSSAKNPGITWITAISTDAVAQLARRIKEHYAIGWWPTMKGPELP